MNFLFFGAENVFFVTVLIFYCAVCPENERLAKTILVRKKLPAECAVGFPLPYSIFASNFGNFVFRLKRR